MAMKKRIAFTWFLALLSTLPVFALQFESGDKVRISQPVHEDIYVFGGTIDIAAPVYGDVWCAGGTVTVSDTVTGDVVVAGGNVYLRGTVLDDVRAAGGTLFISADIGGDLLITGGTATIEPEAVIGGSMAVAGGTISLAGVVKGTLQSAAGAMTLDGTVEKDFEFNGGDLNLNGTIGGAAQIVAKRVVTGDNARLRGNVRYWTEEGEVNFGNSLQSGAKASFDPALRQRFERPDYKFLGFASFMAAIWYLTASFILIWLGQWLFGKVFRNAAVTAQAEPVRSLGYGFLYFIAVPAAAVLLFVTVVGIPVGLIVLLLYGLFFALANIITALVAAHWVERRRKYNWRPVQMMFAALGLLILLKILGFVPFLGWVVKIALIFTAFGAILENTGILRRRQAAQV